MHNEELKPLGRVIPQDDSHIQKYPYSVPQTVSNVEVILPLPDWHWEHDQGSEGACVGFGWRMAKAILDLVRGNPWFIWNEAKKIDQWPDTNPGDSNGTSVRAGGDVLRIQGMPLEGSSVADSRYKIKENRWARTIDEMRTALANKIPVVIGVNWYRNFDTPVLKDGEFWIGQGDLGFIRGGHCVCIYGASDARQGFIFKNSWGKSYPLTWLPYTVMQRLLNEWGEAALITDELEEPGKYIFTLQLTVGSKNRDVFELQKWLNAHGYPVAQYGPGSPGNETDYFGTLTRNAVRKLHRALGMAAPGVPGYGQVGPKTRAYLNSN